MRTLSAFLAIGLLATCASAEDRPNILFFFADDWGRYASSYRNPDGSPSLNDVIETPHIDRIATEGVIFDNAFVPVASCGPCRASLATGQYFWNCGSGAFLNTKNTGWKSKETPGGTDDPFREITKFSDLIRESGYYTISSRKTFKMTPSKKTPAHRAFGPVKYERYGLYVGAEGLTQAERAIRHDEIVKNSKDEIRALLAGCPDDTPFYFTYGSINVHRPYTPDSGANLWNIDPDSLKGLIPPYLPDTDDVRRDFSDYLGEVLALDLKLGAMLEVLEEAGELDNTLVILSGDHGIPGVPRGKTNCYDLATRVPMIARLPSAIPSGRRVEDYISVMDVGPTFLDLAGVNIPAEMDGKSFLPQLKSKNSGWVDEARDRVVIGRERHYHTAREGNLPYPMRAIRSKDFLYIKNFKPERWPMGDPLSYEAADTPEQLYRMGLTTDSGFRDLDGSLTKAFMSSKSGYSVSPDKKTAELWEFTMGHRPAEELYDLRKDPHQMDNVADDPAYAEALTSLRSEVDAIMTESNDPRLGTSFDFPPYAVPGLAAD